MPERVVQIDLPCTGYEVLTVNATDGSIKPTAALCREALMFSVEDDQVRYRIDGGLATDTVGMLLNPFQTVMITNRSNIQKLSLSKVTANASVKVFHFSG